MPAKLCLNMIVRNEAANILRCLASVVDHIGCAVIVDTGSTDDTPGIIREFCGRAGIPLELHHAPFENFEQARNHALKCARASKLEWDYVLLLDADMVLVVEDDPLPALTEPAYHVLQRNNGLAYWNVRLVHRNQQGLYHGVTHEYFDTYGQERRLDGMWFMDHGDGSSHAEKGPRDVRLLCEAILKNPNDERSWFYLGNTYRELGQYNDAVLAYQQRIKLGGWPEEVFCAKLYMARCLLKMDATAGFFFVMSEAHEFRPSRAEPLYDLATHFRTQGKNALATMFAKQALALPPSKDALFVETAAYDLGPLEELSIAGYYVENERAAGAAATNHLMLDLRTSDMARRNARSSMFFYLRGLREYAPSFAAERIAWTPPDEKYICTNPSIATMAMPLADPKLFLIMRTVNYRIRQDGSYDMQGDTAIRTVSHFMELGSDLQPHSGAVDIVPPEDMPPPAYSQVIGFEDCRLFFYHGRPHFNACVREQNTEGWCEQFVASFDPGTGEIAELQTMLRPDRNHEKNWMPFAKSDQVQFMYRMGHIVDADGTTVEKHGNTIYTNDISGGSQLIPFDGGWLAVVHEAWPMPGSGKRFYQHRFAFFDHQCRLAKLSMPFFLNHKGIEFVAGLTRNPFQPDELLISYGVDDREAWIGSVKSDEVRDFLWTC